MSDNLDLYSQIYLLALHNRLNPTLEYQHRCLARWYSHTFSTPYKDAFAMYTEELIQSQCEWLTQELSQADIKKKFKSVFITKKRKVNQIDEDLEWSLKQAEKALKERQQREKEKKEADTPVENKVDDVINQSGVSNSLIGEMPPDIRRTF